MKVKEFIDLVNDSSFFYADLLTNKKLRFRYWEFDTDRFIKKPDIEIVVKTDTLNGIQIKTSETGLTGFDIEQLSQLLTLIKWFKESESNKRIEKAGEE